MSSSPSTAFLRPKLIELLLVMLIASPAQLFAEDSSLPEEHFSVLKPASLSPAEAEAIYTRLGSEMTAAYALSQDPHAASYLRWQRFNTAPYPALTHGSRYVSNYGNGLARSYGSAEPRKPMPEGAVLAKDSFAVTATGEVFPGPLFLMEKMASGFDPEARDWRYSMIMPDGSYFGMTGGDNDEHVRFCVTCHATAGDENDHLFFVPEAYRTSTTE